MLEYKGYTGCVEFDSEKDIFHGEVENLRDVITFQGSSVAELRQAFQDSIDNYLAMCAERREQPEKPYSGKYVVRIDPEMHRDAAIAAAKQGKTMDQWTSDAIREAIFRSNKTHSSKTLVQEAVKDAKPKPAAKKTKARKTARKRR